LLEAVKQAVAAPGRVSAQPVGNSLKLSFTGNSLGSYDIQWTSNLITGNWKTLALTNITGPGGGIQVTDTGVFTNQSPRFYRVLTPP
jgi:hypothetical protein